MYVYLGGNAVVKDKDIIGIFDIDKTTVSKKTRDFLNNEEKSGRVEYSYGEFDIPKTFVLCKHKARKEKTLFSALTVSTIEKRTEINLNK